MGCAPRRVLTQRHLACNYVHQPLQPSPADQTRRDRGRFHRVPEEPGLGVTVDREAVERWRVSDDTVQKLKERGALYDKPSPRIICTVTYPDGTRIHIAPMNRAYGYFVQGTHPRTRTGSFCDIVHDDGSKDWAVLYDRAREHPGAAGARPDLPRA